MYVTELVVADTVTTMPEPTLHAVAEHGELRGDTVTGTATQAKATFDALQRVGIDLTDVFGTLENEGVGRFDASWAELAATVGTQLDRHH